VRPGAGSAGNYRSPGYGTNYGTNFAGGAGRYGGGSSGYSGKALGLGVGAGFLGGALVGTYLTVATMGVYHRYNEYQRLMYLRQNGYYNDDYYNTYIRRGQCFDGCPKDSHCIFGLCQCNPGREQSVGGCYTRGTSVPPRPEGFDPYLPCTDSRICHAMDINLVCWKNSTNLTGTTRCSCRRDMKWNNATGECQLYLDVDCSGITYETKPSPIILEAANATMQKQEGKENATLLGEEKETLENSTSILDPALAINQTLSNSLLTSIDPKKASEADIKEAFCRDVDSFSLVLVKKEPTPNHAVPTAVGVVVALVLLSVCCCGCFICCCKEKAKSCFGRKKSRHIEDSTPQAEQMSFAAVKPAENMSIGGAPYYQQGAVYPPADSYPQASYPVNPTYPPTTGYPPQGGLPYPPQGGQPYPGPSGQPYPPPQSGFPAYPPAYSS